MTDVNKNRLEEEVKKIKERYENQYKFPYTKVDDKDVWIMFLGIQTGELQFKLDKPLKCSIGEQFDPLVLSKKMKDSFYKKSKFEETLNRREQMFFKALKNFKCSTDLNDDWNHQITYLRNIFMSEAEDDDDDDDERDEIDEGFYIDDRMRMEKQKRKGWWLNWGKDAVVDGPDDDNDEFIFNDETIHEFNKYKRQYDNLCIRYNYFEKHKEFLNFAEIRTYFGNKYDFEKALQLGDDGFKYIERNLFKMYYDSMSKQRFVKFYNAVYEENDIEKAKSCIEDQLGYHLNQVFCNTFDNFDSDRQHLVVCMFFMYVYSYFYPYCLFLEARENMILGDENRKLIHNRNLQSRLKHITTNGYGEKLDFESDVEMYAKIKEFSPFGNTKREFEVEIYDKILHEYNKFVSGIEDACDEECGIIFREIFSSPGSLDVTWSVLKNTVLDRIDSDTLESTEFNAKLKDAMTHFNNMVELFNQLEYRMNQTKENDIANLKELLFYNDRDELHIPNVKKKLLISYLGKKIKDIQDKSYGDVRDVEDIPASKERIAAMNCCIKEFEYFCGQIRVGSNPDEKIGSCSNINRMSFKDLLGKPWTSPLSVVR